MASQAAAPPDAGARGRSTEWCGADVVLFDEEIEDSGEPPQDVQAAGDSSSELAPKVSPLSESSWIRCRSSPPVSTPPTAEEVISWEFDVLRYTEPALVEVVAHMFNHYDLLNKFSVDRDVFNSFVHAVMARHNPHVYHNWHHGVSCMHVAFLLVSLAGADKYLNDADIFALLFGALVHDVDHAGHNNDFEVKAGTALARRYSNMSVLENHSIKVTFDEILALPGCNIMAGLENNDREYTVAVATDVVKWTDPAKHGDLLRALAEKLEEAERLTNGGSDNRGSSNENGKSSAPQLEIWDGSDPLSKQLLCRMIVHAADISNPVHESFAVVQDWCARINTEFAKQASEEKRLGLKVTPFMDGLDDEYRVAKQQVEFYTYMAMPFFSQVGRALPGAARLAQKGRENLAQYKKFVNCCSSLT